ALRPDGDLDGLGSGPQVCEADLGAQGCPLVLVDGEDVLGGERALGDAHGLVVVEQGVVDEGLQADGGDEVHGIGAGDLDRPAAGGEEQARVTADCNTVVSQ